MKERIFEMRKKLHCEILHSLADGYLLHILGTCMKAKSERKKIDVETKRSKQQMWDNQWAYLLISKCLEWVCVYLLACVEVIYCYEGDEEKEELRCGIYE